MQERVLSLDLVLEQELDHLQVLVVDAHEERGPAQRVDTIDIDAISGALQHPEHLQSFPRTMFRFCFHGSLYTDKENYGKTNVRTWSE